MTADANRFSTIGDGRVGVNTVDLTTVLEMTHDNEEVYLCVDEPDQLRYLAARLLVEAQELEDRIAVHNGTGGDE